MSTSFPSDEGDLHPDEPERYPGEEEPFLLPEAYPPPVAPGSPGLEGMGRVFGGEIPEAERAWRRGGEDVSAPKTISDAQLWAIESLPAALRELRTEVRRAADLASDALNTAASVARTGDGERSGVVDPLPAALRELREEVRQSGDRATEALAATRNGMGAVPALVSGLREEVDAAVGRIAETVNAANLEAARAFALVAREVRSLGDRQLVLREEVKLLGKRLEELERLRRRQQPRPRAT
jgi:hypothetical protein